MNGTVLSARNLRTTFVINPVSGRAASRAVRRTLVENFIKRHQLAATVEVTRRAGHAHELARSAVEQGVELVVSVGGDGTMNEVASALIHSETVYGMIPTGSGNGLGRDLGISLDVDRALDLLLDGTVREIDTGEVNGLPFFNVMGLGFDAEIGRRFNLSRRRGFLTYLSVGLQTFFTTRKESIIIEAEGHDSATVDAFVTAVANSTQYGNNARIAPRARLDDGQLDLVAITTSNVVAALPLAVGLFRGTIDRSKRVRTLQAPRFRIRRRRPGPVHTDGEVHDCSAVLEIASRPRSLRVLVPRRSARR